MDLKFTRRFHTDKLCSIALIVTWFLINSVDSRLKLNLQQVECQLTASDICNVSLCQLKAVKRDVAEMSIHVMPIQKSINNISLYVTLKRSDVEHNVPFYEDRVDVCQFLRSRRRNPLIQIFYTLAGFTKYTNVNHSCPYNHEMILEKYRFDDTHLRMLPLPVGRYTLGLNWFSYNIHCCDIHVGFQILNI